jgi:hypothetical protein
VSCPLTLFVLGGTCTQAVEAKAQNVVQNGCLELPYKPTGSSRAYLPQTGWPVPDHWAVAPFIEPVVNWFWKWPGLPWDACGGISVSVEGAELSQTLNTTPGRYYNLTFLVSLRPYPVRLSWDPTRSILLVCKDRSLIREKVPYLVTLSWDPTRSIMFVCGDRSALSERVPTCRVLVFVAVWGYRAADACRALLGIEEGG